MRKIISIDRFHANLETRYDFRLVIWGTVESETKTTYRMDRLVAYIYYRGEVVGLSARAPKKCITVYKKSLRLPDYFDQAIKEAQQDALNKVLTRGQVFNARIRYFDNNRGEGMAEVFGVGMVPIYGCNAHNALTGYSETACITMNEGQLFSCKLGEVQHGLTCTDYTGNFDQAQSDKLDHSKLAFLRRDGKFVSGLFAK